jgi:hypothetical protein
VSVNAQDTSAYAPELQWQMVDLVRAGRDPTDLAREFAPSAQAIRSHVYVNAVAESFFSILEFELLAHRPRGSTDASSRDAAAISHVYPTAHRLGGSLIPKQKLSAR